MAVKAKEIYFRTEILMDSGTDIYCPFVSLIQLPLNLLKM